jgi:hypothetical protein
MLCSFGIATCVVTEFHLSKPHRVSSGFPLGLSRACLGKLMHFQYIEWHRKRHLHIIIIMRCCCCCCFAPGSARVVCAAAMWHPLIIALLFAVEVDLLDRRRRHRCRHPAMSCHAMSCHVMSCHGMSTRWCVGSVSFVLWCHAMSCHVMPCHVNALLCWIGFGCMSRHIMSTQSIAFVPL